MLPFPIEEYRHRIAEVKERMIAAGVDVYIGTHPANMNYLTGYDGWSFYVHQCVVVSLDADLPVWFGREMDVPGAQATVWMTDSELHSYPDECVDNLEHHPLQKLADLLIGNRWSRGRIGVEMDSWYYTAKGHAVLTDALPEASWHDVWPMVNRVRLIKSDNEIDLIRGAGKIVSRAMRIAMDVIEPGVRENDAVATITQAQIAGADDYWGDYPAALASVPSGSKSSAPHLTWTGAPFEHESAVNVELGGCHHRYHAALARTLFLGSPPQKLIDLASATKKGLESALQAASAGNSCESVESAWARAMQKAGYEKHSRIGYSIGLNYPPDWGEQSASLRQGDKTELKPNMCFHLMLGMWMDGWGYELSETIRITESAPELLTSYPQELSVKR